MTAHKAKAIVKAHESHHGNGFDSTSIFMKLKMSTSVVLPAKESIDKYIQYAMTT